MARVMYFPVLASYSLVVLSGAHGRSSLSGCRKLVSMPGRTSNSTNLWCSPSNLCAVLVTGMLTFTVCSEYSSVVENSIRSGRKSRVWLILLPNS